MMAAFGTFPTTSMTPVTCNSTVVVSYPTTPGSAFSLRRNVFDYPVRAAAPDERLYCPQFRNCLAPLWLLLAALADLLRPQAARAVKAAATAGDVTLAEVQWLIRRARRGRPIRHKCPLRNFHRLAAC
jgi:hypothetical protein